MKILVCGSRGWDDEATIADVLSDYVGQDVTVIHGAARGADRLAGEVARFYGFEVREFPADWNRYGKRAGFLRNVAMLEEGPDRVIAFHDGSSRGTQHTIDQARKRGIPVEVITPFGSGIC